MTMRLSSKVLQNKITVLSNPNSHSAFEELERSVYNALQTYSNVQRGSGQCSKASTSLFEKAREIVLEYLQLDKSQYVVIFCSPHRAEILKAELLSSSFQILSSQDIGLPIGLRIMVVKKSALPKGVPSQTGGGMIKLVSPNSLVLADVPERFEAGTPSIINAITFAKALQIMKILGTDIFKVNDRRPETTTAKKILFQDNFLEYSGRKILVRLRKCFIDRDLSVPVLEGERQYTNLDNAASTPTLLPIWNAVCQTWKQSQRVQKNIIPEVKEICAKFFNASLNDYDLIFCSNTTEAINIAVQNLECNFVKDIEPVILNTFLEHHSNELPWRYSSKISLIRLAADDEGFINLNRLEHILQQYNQKGLFGKKRILIVAVCGASNVLGSFNDIRTIARITHKYNAHILVDGAQLVAHRKISMSEDEIDYLAFSGHKMYAPFGSGALIIKKELLNFQSDKIAKIKASGEENIIGIAAMGKAITLLQRIGMDVIKDAENTLTRHALQSLSKIPGVKIFGVQDPNSDRFRNKGGIIVFSMKNVPHNLVSKELAEIGGIGVRTGCFCAHLITKQVMRIHPLRSFAATVLLKLLPWELTEALPGLVRVSFGLGNDEFDVDHLIKTLQKIAATPRSFINKAIASTFNGTLFLSHTSVQKHIDEFLKIRIQKVYSLSLDR
jgi:selenocysteine lyase/cysteine desulfurase